MKLLLDRNPTGLTCTIGDLLANGRPFCNSLEPPIREVPGKPVAAWKVDGDTAIPAGIYEVRLTYSPAAAAGRLWTPRADFKLPEIIGVPDFSGIRIHAANTGADVEACVGVGHWSGGEFLFGSRSVLSSLIDLLEVAEIGRESVELEVANPT